MPTPMIVIVNASSVISDDDVAQWAEDIHAQVVEDFAPVWNKPARVVFEPWKTWQSTTVHDAWPVYVNRHSNDPMALGWHDNAGNMVMGRVFAQDCLNAKISVSVDLSHEILEIIGDPDIRQTITLPDGRVAALEMCDAVEDDIHAYTKGHTMVSNFVLPQYFRPTTPANVSRWDFMGHLTGPCPVVAPGGYQSIYANSQWTQVMGRNLSGEFSHRALRHGRNFRRMMGRMS